MSVGAHRKIDYEAVATFSAAHPGMPQKEIAKEFHTTQGRICAIERAAGVRRKNGGRAPKLKPGASEDRHYWEITLSRLGLGMDVGLRLNGKRIFYGFELSKAASVNKSATIVE